jgi:hypothetical protein
MQTSLHRRHYMKPVKMALLVCAGGGGSPHEAATTAEIGVTTRTSYALTSWLHGADALWSCHTRAHSPELETDVLKPCSIKIHFSITRLSVSMSSKCSFHFRFSQLNFGCVFHLPHAIRTLQPSSFLHSITPPPISECKFWSTSYRYLSCSRFRLSFQMTLNLH